MQACEKERTGGGLKKRELALRLKKAKATISARRAREANEIKIGIVLVLTQLVAQRHADEFR